jgi:hypothetical protein
MGAQAIAGGGIFRERIGIGRLHRLGDRLRKRRGIRPRLLGELIQLAGVDAGFGRFRMAHIDVSDLARIAFGGGHGLEHRPINGSMGLFARLRRMLL